MNNIEKENNNEILYANELENYKMTRYNLNFTYLNYNHTDRYDLSEEENHVIYKFANKTYN